ncbi:acetyl-CoA C-acyltransferase [Haematospirillum jordaniae]|uniref:Acetyl-CoA acetyltransferase n=1 Tax=Haematospirillum jordaniae TaxID=1549855 RepID=A0A143DBC1_9PROT|nr:acetyl-CoA C-acyltransferase [Haematospirillum jordaniae]AMW33946.1 acetyl-CoA acetyltransferase [Haematospirillum jordaniae]NKD44408.1 acetyl-CoA C-acyltransferase [Haematospirillum jordaniae]NKD57428.1 acetyl-CoA C-acyltransferase [Haematospirillum jordaniae]NKD59874.1 acetyl-CoA C-acyltransferase [Haematospirillum jordaniae]NKD67741.1 acetyl-CoA C-acyltransferase [Haematospirillum jordaniae]
MTRRGDDPVVIVGSARTPTGGFRGCLSSLSCPALGSVAVRAAVERSGVDVGDLDEVVMGCVLSAGLGQAPARQALLGAGLPDRIGATTVNKMCGSGMRAAMMAYDMLVAGSASVVVAGGMESMSNAPYLLENARSGLRMGHGRVLDHMFLDGLEDAYDRGRLMGAFAEDTAAVYGFSRQQQDAFALGSLERALAAARSGAAAAEITPVAVPAGNGEARVTVDEPPTLARPEKVPTLKPVFRPDGTITAANASSISDGAAALVMMRLSDAERRGLSPVATLVAHATEAREPPQFTTAPVGAIQRVLGKAGWSKRDVDLWEINEAFAVVTMVAIHDLGLLHDAVNIHGGACALGHPIGASGARIIVTLLQALRQNGLKRGIASLCIGGGEATALALELVM